MKFTIVDIAKVIVKLPCEPYFCVLTNTIALLIFLSAEKLQGTMMEWHLAATWSFWSFKKLRISLQLFSLLTVGMQCTGMIFKCQVSIFLQCNVIPCSQTTLIQWIFDGAHLFFGGVVSTLTLGNNTFSVHVLKQLNQTDLSRQPPLALCSLPLLQDLYLSFNGSKQVLLWSIQPSLLCCYTGLYVRLLRQSQIHDRREQSTSVSYLK